MRPRAAFVVFALTFLAGTAALETTGGVRAFERALPSLEGFLLPRRGFPETSTEDALALARSWRGRDKRRAIQVLEEKLDVVSRREPGQATTIRLRLGDLHRELGRVPGALSYYRGALEASTTPAVAVAAQSGMARALLRQDDLEGALGHAESALRLAQESRLEELEAPALLTLGIVLFEEARFDEALHYLHEAQALAERAGDVRTRTEASLHVGFTRSDMGAEWEAVGVFQSALAASRSERDRALEALALLGLGHTYSKLGEKQRALELYVLAKPLIEAMEDPVRTASLDTGLGYLYTELGDYENAERYYTRALALNDLVRSRWGRAANLIHLARLHSAAERPEKAVTAFHAAITDLQKLPDRGMEAAIRGELAAVLDRLGRHAEAEQAYGRALGLSEQSGSARSQAELLNDIASYEIQRGRPDDARTHSGEALRLSRSSNSRFAEAQALFNIARAERDDGDVDEALKDAESALALVEELRAKLASYRLRSAFIASVYELQELHVSLLMALDRSRPGAGFDRRAFLAAEIAKARSLLDHVSAGEAAESGDPTLLAYAQRLRRRIAERAEAWDRRRGARGEDGAESVPDELEELLLELERVESALRGTEGPWAAARGAPLSDVADIQRDFLDENTTLLSYFLGRQESYLWIVTTSTFQAHRLPPRGAIESRARRIHGLLADRDRQEEETAIAHRRRVEEAERSYWLEVKPLAETVLGPALRDLGTHRLLVAADGALHLLPFSILPLPDSGDTPRPLIARYEVVRLASASVWNAILRRRKSRDHRPKRLALIADPVFDAGDPRVSSGTAPPSLAASAAGAASRSRLREGPEVSSAAGALALPRLLSTRQEANAISSLLLPEEQLRALGFRASRSLVTGGELASYDVVHFATHGVSSAQQPELSGIALSFIDPSGRPENGFLRLDDIERLRLPVSLVVLSACSTALGKDVPGEGVISLVGGFLTAGADGVVASYWKVEDEATAELMRNFYVGLFSERLPAPTALQRAQRSMLAQERWSSPYYVGAFEFHGSWR